MFELLFAFTDDFDETTPKEIKLERLETITMSDKYVKMFYKWVVCLQDLEIENNNTAKMENYDAETTISHPRLSFRHTLSSERGRWVPWKKSLWRSIPNVIVPASGSSSPSSGYSSIRRSGLGSVWTNPEGGKMEGKRKREGDGSSRLRVDAVGRVSRGLLEPDES